MTGQRPNPLSSLHNSKRGEAFDPQQALEALPASLTTHPSAHKGGELCTSALAFFHKSAAEVDPAWFWRFAWASHLYAKAGLFLTGFLTPVLIFAQVEGFEDRQAFEKRTAKVDPALCQCYAWGGGIVLTITVPISNFVHAETRRGS
jgi:hypothetical protein